MGKAVGLGFEPRYADPESAVLPLDDPTALPTNYFQITSLTLFVRHLFLKMTLYVLLLYMFRTLVFSIYPKVYIFEYNYFP